MNKPLAGIRVADFSHFLPGPLAARRLQDLGAEVCKVELPHWPDPARGYPEIFAWLHRGQRYLTLDFRKPEGMRALERFLAREDVLIEGFRPGLMDRLGLGWERLSKLFPKLVYASITGRGRAGSRAAGHDLNFEAEAGILGSPPRMPGVPVADVAAALRAGGEIAAALYRRERTGRGSLVDVSLAGAAQEASLFGLGEELGEDPFYGLYETKDGGWLAVAALETRLSSELLRALGRQELGELDRKKDAKRLRRALARVFRTRTLTDWTKRLAPREACVTPVRPRKRRAR